LIETKRKENGNFYNLKNKRTSRIQSIIELKRERETFKTRKETQRWREYK
jgi:hypothetical protein